MWKVSICDAVNCILWVGLVEVLELDLVQVDVGVRKARSRWNNMGVGLTVRIGAVGTMIRDKGQGQRTWRWCVDWNQK